MDRESGGPLDTPPGTQEDDKGIPWSHAGQRQEKKEPIAIAFFDAKPYDRYFFDAANEAFG